MKKYIIIAVAAVVTSLGLAYAANSLHQAEHHSKCENGMKCFSCKGTGWNGQFKCHMCKGSGASSSY